MEAAALNVHGVTEQHVFGGLTVSHDGATDQELAAGGRHAYRATAPLNEPDRLLLRGWVGLPIIGRTTRWIRVGTEVLCLGRCAGIVGAP